MTEGLDNTTQTFDFFKTTMPDSRKADFYLGCLEGSVFLDFNYTTDNCISLCRISFDGYGSCNIDNNATCLDKQLSKEFIEEIEKNKLDQNRVKRYVLELIRLNSDNIWQDALEEYKLMGKAPNPYMQPYGDHAAT
jgi:hypothetical protein